MLFIILFTLISLFSGCSENAHSKLPVDGKAVESIKDGYADNTGSVTMVKAPFYEDIEGLPNIEVPEGFDWKQFSDITLNFISENNLYANVLSKESGQFTKVTGIKVKIHPVDFNSMIEKINLDFISKTGKYQVVYVDPYQTLTRFRNKLVDLNEFNDDPALPHIPGGINDFFESQVDGDSYFLNRYQLYAIPFDSPTMILFYRKDIFEKYRQRFMEEKGYDWMPGTKDFTWERYYEAAEWINRNVPKTEVKYGCGHQAKRHNSLFCDFSNILAAYGGNYFKDANIGSLGSENPSECTIMNENSIKALEMYKKILRIAHPSSASWDWYDSAQAFKAGEIALMPGWNEYCAPVEDPNNSRVAGRVGYSLLPYGPSRSANIFGGSGIGINKDASKREQMAAWLFIVWATSPHTELLVLKHPEGGDVPLRKSVYNVQEIKDAMIEGSAGSKKFPALLSVKTVLKAWEIENTYQRPKVLNGPSIEKIITDELYKMITNDISAKETARSMARQIDAIMGR